MSSAISTCIYPDFGSVGKKNSNPDVICQIIPFSFRVLLDANELIFTRDPTRGCACCRNSSSTGICRCSLCKQVYYCGKVSPAPQPPTVRELANRSVLQKCQTIAWKVGYMDACPAVEQLAWFMEQDWAHSQKSLVF